MMYFMCVRGAFEERRHFFIVEKNVSIFILSVVSGRNLDLVGRYLLRSQN